MRERTIIFDIETVRPVRMANEAEWPGIAYADSWTDYKGMGIACIGVFDFEERRFRMFGADDLAAFRRLLRDRSRFVGWNNHKFDNPLLAAHGIDVDPAGSFDLMELFPVRLKLDKAAEMNGIAFSKAMPGKEAPIRWQQGQYARVIDYCLGDVHATSLLYSKFCKQGYLLDHTGKGRVGMGAKLPWTEAMRPA